MKTSSEYIKRATDKTGADILIRPVRRDDEARLNEFYLGLSERTARSFYGYSVDRSVLAREIIEQRCDADGGMHLFLIAVASDNTIVGIGALVRFSYSEAEYEAGLIIADGHQENGIGALFMEVLIAYASGLRIGAELVAYTTTTNAGARKLLQKFKFVLKSSEEGVMTWTYAAP